MGLVIKSPAPAPWDIDCSKDAVLTKQEFVSDCDVNVIIGRCLKSGLPLPSSTVEPMYADVSRFGDYADALRLVKDAENVFDSLPAQIRTRFDNDPGSLIRFVADPASRPEAVSLGLIVEPPVAVAPAVVPVPAVAPVVVAP